MYFFRLTVFFISKLIYDLHQWYVFISIQIIKSEFVSWFKYLRLRALESVYQLNADKYGISIKMYLHIHVGSLQQIGFIHRLESFERLCYLFKLAGVLFLYTSRNSSRMSFPRSPSQNDGEGLGFGNLDSIFIFEGRCY